MLTCRNAIAFKNDITEKEYRDDDEEEVYISRLGLKTKLRMKQFHLNLWDSIDWVTRLAILSSSSHRRWGDRWGPQLWLDPAKLRNYWPLAWSFVRMV